MRTIIFFFCLIATAFSYAADECVKEGDSIATTAKMKTCCPGLERMAPPPGIVGSAGTCHKKERNMYCYGEGKFRMGYTMLPCCQGLGAFVTNNQLREFECRKVKTCVEENQQIVRAPGNPLVCCQGLQPKLPSTGRMDGATCVKPELLNCLGEGAPVFQHPGSPKCCPGLVAGKAPTISPVTFSDICVREDKTPRVNNGEIRKEKKSFLRDDPEESRVSGE